MLSFHRYRNCRHSIYRPPPLSRMASLPPLRHRNSSSHLSLLSVAFLSSLICPSISACIRSLSWTNFRISSASSSSLASVLVHFTTMRIRRPIAGISRIARTVIAVVIVHSAVLIYGSHMFRMVPIQFSMYVQQCRNSPECRGYQITDDTDGKCYRPNLMPYGQLVSSPTITKSTVAATPALLVMFTSNGALAATNSPSNSIVPLPINLRT